MTRSMGFDTIQQAFDSGEQANYDGIARDANPYTGMGDASAQTISVSRAHFVGQCQGDSMTSCTLESALRLLIPCRNLRSHARFAIRALVLEWLNPKPGHWRCPTEAKESEILRAIARAKGEA